MVGYVGSAAQSGGSIVLDDHDTGHERSDAFARLRDRFAFVTPLFAATVIVPTLLAAAYFGFLASDVYVSESRFVVRSPAKTGATPLGAVLGTNIGGSSEESAAVTEYLESRRALSEVNEDGFVMHAYSAPSIFWLTRFGGTFGVTDEELYRYFQDRLTIDDSATTQVTRLTVRAFSPKDAQIINARLLERSEALVNSLSQHARTDSIAVAQGEVEDAKTRSRDAALELAAYRDRARIIDPEQQAAARLQMISKLQDELIAARTQLRQLQTYTPRASQIPFLRTQARELQGEIDTQMDAIAGGRGSLSAAAAQYQELQLNAEFAEKQLGIALASLQDAQAEARRKTAYLDRIASPSLPDYASEPRRLRGIAATFIFGLLAWGVLSMLAVGVREHRD
ncbi:MAG: hypothetical protein WA948_09885 [Pontixanthobacter sp.]